MSEIKYRSLRHWKYELLEATKCEVDIPEAVGTEYITVNAGALFVHARYAWDGPSGPTFDTKTFMRGSLFHDALCQLICDGALDKKYRKYADELLRVHMLEDQVLDADGKLKIYGAGGRIIYESKKKTGWKRKIYLS